MKKLLLTVLLLLSIAAPASARGKLQGWVNRGGQKVTYLLGPILTWFSAKVSE